MSATGIEVPTLICGKSQSFESNGLHLWFQLPFSYINVVLRALLPIQLPCGSYSVHPRGWEAASVRHQVRVHVGAATPGLLRPPHLPPSWVPCHYHVSYFILFKKLLSLRGKILIIFFTKSTTEFLPERDIMRIIWEKSLWGKQKSTLIFSLSKINLYCNQTIITYCYYYRLSKTFFYICCIFLSRY